MYVEVNFFMLGNFCFSFVLGYDNILYANEVETKEKQKLVCTWVEHTGKYEAYKAGVFCCVINLDVQLTRVGASQKMIPRERLTRQNREGPAPPPCLPSSMYLWVPL